MKPDRNPTPAIPCRCANPLADARDHTCVWCGHQVNGAPIPTGRSYAREPEDHSTFATATRKYRPAA